MLSTCLHVFVSMRVNIC